jgi:hypothetical protein
MSFETWGVVEAMGHHSYAGHISEVSVAGCLLVRVDVPETTGYPAFTKLLSSGAIYAITPCTEAEAVLYAARLQSRPFSFALQDREDPRQIYALAASATDDDDDIPDPFAVPTDDDDDLDLGQ